MTTPKRSLDDLNLTPSPIDDRWTAQSLAQAGYTYSGTRRCRDGCGTEIALYRRETLRGTTWKILDEGTLEPHQCG